jgi:branched-chain amino acid transport system ATP-binding protein
MSARSRKLLAGLPLLPVAVLFLINFFDQFDTAAFTILTPEIKKAFHLSTAGISAISVVNVVFTSTFVLAIGYLADRSERRRLVVFSGVLAGAASFATGAAWAVWILVVLRLANGAGRLVNDPVHTSLISDYYPPVRRAEAFAFHRSAEPLGMVAAPLLVLALADLVSWRAFFFVVAIPAVLIALYAARLPEPLQGQSEDPEAAAETADDEPLSFGRAYRRLYHVRTLRRIWLAQFFVGGGLGPMIGVITLYWENVFHVGIRGRSLIAVVGAAATLLGVAAAGPITARLLKEGPHRAQLFAGMVLTANAAMLLVVASARSLGIAIAAFAIISLGFGLFTTPSVTVAAAVIPARVRSQGLSYGPLFMALGAIASLPLAGIADSHGYRWSIFAFSPLVILAGLTFASAYRFVAGDIDRARRSLETDAMLREERKKAGVRSLLVCRGLDVSYDLVPVLHGVDLDVREGEIVALLGTNGAGKSTVLRTIAGLMHPDNGVVFFDGRDLTFHEPEETQAAGVVFAPGPQSLFPDLTVVENLLAAGWSLRHTPTLVTERVDEVLDLFPRLGERLGHRAGTLSGGEQQMLGLAQAMMSRPKLLMIDELTLGLAPKVVGELLDIVRRIHATGVTLILVEQSVNVALTVADRAYFLERGEVRFNGPTADLLERDDILRAVFLKPEVLHS